VHAGTETITAADLELLKNFFTEFVFSILGLKEESVGGGSDIDALLQMILKVRTDAKANKDFSTSDKIRDELAAIGFKIKDEKSGTSWTRE